MMKKKALKKLLVLVVVVVMMAGCAQQAATPPAPVPAAPGAQPEQAPAPDAPDIGVDWPTRTVTLVVPYSPGGGNDTTGRLIARYFSDRFGSMVVTNITGSAGLVGTQHVLDSAPDGYTLIFNDTNPDKQYVAGQVDFSMEDAWEGFFIVGTSDFASLQVARWETLEETIEWAHANPGQLRFGGAIGTNTEMAAAAFFQEFDIDGQFLDVGDTGDQLAAMAGGHIDIIHIPVGMSRDFVAAGEFHVVAFLRDERHPDAALAHVPTLIEMGAPGWLHMPRYFFIGMPGGTDPEIVEALGLALENIVNDPEFAADMHAVELTARFMNQEEAMEHVLYTREIWREYAAAVASLFGR